MRAIIRRERHPIADSCGYGVPLMSYEGERPHMDLSTAKRLRVEGPGAMRRLRAAITTGVHRRAPGADMSITGVHAIVYAEDAETIARSCATTLDLRPWTPGRPADFAAAARGDRRAPSAEERPGRAVPDVRRHRSTMA